jgi:hypothetical protein
LTSPSTVRPAIDAVVAVSVRSLWDEVYDVSELDEILASTAIKTAPASQCEQARAIIEEPDDPIIDGSEQEVMVACAGTDGGWKADVRRACREGPEPVGDSLLVSVPGTRRVIAPPCPPANGASGNDASAGWDDGSAWDDGSGFGNPDL